MAKLKNSYSESTRTHERIQKVLINHRAKQMMFDYDDDGKITALSFVMEYNGMRIPVRLPARLDGVAYLMYHQRYDQLPQAKQDQAYRTAWANIRDWVEAQLALVDTQMVKMEEVFLPYMINARGQTFFEVMERNQFLLPEGN